MIPCNVHEFVSVKQQDKAEASTDLCPNLCNIASRVKGSATSECLHIGQVYVIADILDDYMTIPQYTYLYRQQM